MSSMGTSTVPIFDRNNDGMPGRLKLSPLQRDILIMLEEAGAETVSTVVATLTRRGTRSYAKSSNL